MSESVELINVSSLTELAQDDAKQLVATAKPFNGDMRQGHLLHVTDGSQKWVVSTYLSDTPKLYKRADALLKDAKKMGLSSVTFEL